jgi:type IV secretory pathway VirB3-like protein
VVDVLVSVTLSSLLLAFVLFLMWLDARYDARYWKADSDHWFDAWLRASKRRPRRDPADWWKD